MHLPFTPCSHAAASSACFASTPAPSVLLATTLTLSAFLNSVPISSKYFNAPITGITLIRSSASMAHTVSNFFLYSPSRLQYPSYLCRIVCIHFPCFFYYRSNFFVVTSCLSNICKW